jgi:hypothetical protein
MPNADTLAIGLSLSFWVSDNMFYVNKKHAYIPGAIWLLQKPSLAFEASTDPVGTSAQLPLHPTKPRSRWNLLIQLTWQCDMSFCSLGVVQLRNWRELYSCQFCIISVEITIVRPIDRCILGLHRCIGVCAEMSRHCKHSSTAKNLCYFCTFVIGMQRMP